MADAYTHKKLKDVKDSAVDFGVGDDMEARFATEDLDAEDTGFSHHRLEPDKRQPFAHVHQEAEEVYVVIRGTGRVKLDGEIVEIEELDAIRVSPTVTRCFEAGGDGLELIAFGPRMKGDGEVVQDWWTD
jgi:mannose-6-phosphate isomerase-like protein (cupin superfamily)